MTDVFLSYSRENSDYADDVASDLMLEGFDVFFDRRIPVGTAWELEIERQLETAACVVVLWSSQSKNSDWVRREARAAADRSILRPAMIENCRPPVAHSDLQTANLVGRRRGELQNGEWRRLIESIQVLVDAKGEDKKISQPGHVGHTASPKKLMLAYGEPLSPDTLLEGLGLSLARRRGSQYQATKEGPAAGYRWWATQFAHGNSFFGVQRSPRQLFERHDANRFRAIGFLERRNGQGGINEMVVELTGTTEEKMRDARIVIARVTGLFSKS